MNKKTIDAVDQRAQGMCEGPNCPGPDFRGLQRAHITPKKMGGRNGEMAKIIDDPRNVCLLCAFHHDILDNRIKSPFRDFLTRYLKKKIDWYEWQEEHSV